MTSTSTINADINTFVAAQNINRGQGLDGGGTLALDYNALSGPVPAGDNAVTGIAGIAAGAATITLPSGQFGNAVIVDGGVSTSASTSGADSYSFLVNTSRGVTITDNNTGNSEAITNASYLIFDGGATTSTGAYQSAYLIETGVMAEVASMYNAAFGRVPDFAGLEYNGIPVVNGVLNLHQTAEDFLASPEFAARYTALTAPADDGGPNDQLFITELYGQILHRTPSSAEVQYYVDALQGTLTTSSGATIPACDRATLLVYFSISPENQADISASNGGWLINPANGAVSLGAMSTATATTVLTSEAATGTVNAADFAGMANNSYASTQISGGTVGVGGDAIYGSGNWPYLSSTAPNITLDLSSKYYTAYVEAANSTVSGSSSGGNLIVIENNPVWVIAGTTAEAAHNGSGTINLAGNSNWISVGTAPGALTSLPVTTTVNGWNATDLVVGGYFTLPSQGNTMASLGTQTDGVLYQGSSSSPVSGASLGGQNLGTWFSSHQLAINVGPIASDSVATIVAAANKYYTVADIGTVGQGTSETAYFFGQDPHGNTLLVYWHGDSTHAGTILASDIVGVIELVGVQASSLTSANFHL